MSTFVVKMIAIITMIIDHFGAVFGMPMYFRVIGRVAFPLFVFLIAEGCRHTKSMEKYILRLGIFALVSEVPFDLAIRGSGLAGVDFLNNTNIFYTLWLGVVCVYVLQKIKGLIQDKVDMFYNALWLVVPAFVFGAMWLADWLGTDYGGIGVLFVFLTAAAAQFDEIKHQKFIQMAVITLFMFVLYFDTFLIEFNLPLDFWLQHLGNHFLLASLVAVVVVAFYNGKRGLPVKWLFYVIYPAHLLLFAIVRGI